MKVNASTVNMDSGRVYSNSTEMKQTTTMTQAGTGNRTVNVKNFKATYTEYSGVSLQLGNGQNINQNDGQNGGQTPTVSTEPVTYGPSLTSIKDQLEELHNQLIDQLEKFMEQIRNQLLGRGRSIFQNNPQSAVIDLSSGGGQPGSLFTRQESLQITYNETEITTFNGNGVVETADGRHIEFNLSMEMSRSFTQACESISESTQYILTDPLVVKLNDAPDTIGTQKMLFDLDCDGQMEEMATLSEGNGFLTLDKNGNGIVDDGSELFGTKSGNGFADLSEYDEDNNGWIDENDSVYSKLKIWTKDEKGNDKLLNLAAADIGAIYLGSAKTQFHENDGETNETLAMVRKTGMYLHESTGLAGSIQQIDFATKKATSVA